MTRSTVDVAPSTTTMVGMATFLLFSVVSAAENGEYIKVYQKMSKTPTTETATYECDLHNLWTEERHPQSFPGGAHWSPSVLVTHDMTYTMFAIGGQATDGVENVAETGGTGTIRDEIDAFGDAILQSRTGSLWGADIGDRDSFSNVRLDAEHPYLSIISMIAPSPDWFSGVASFDMRNEDGTMWKQEIVLDLPPWDSGTDGGQNYNSGNDNLSPAEPISIITFDTLPSSGALRSPENRTVLPVARLQCRLNGKNGSRCRHELLETCAKSRHCCPGLSCMGTMGSGRKCQPCLKPTQRCRRNSDCCKDYRCKGRGTRRTCRFETK